MPVADTWGGAGATTHSPAAVLPLGGALMPAVRMAAPPPPCLPACLQLELGNSGDAAVAKYNLEEMQRAERKVCGGVGGGALSAGVGCVGRHGAERWGGVGVKWGEGMKARPCCPTWPTNPPPPSPPDHPSTGGAPLA